MRLSANLLVRSDLEHSGWKCNEKKSNREPRQVAECVRNRHRYDSNVVCNSRKENCEIEVWLSLINDLS